MKKSKCKNCNKQFKIYHYWVKIGRGKFCSQKCHGEFRTKNGIVTKKCIVCNKEFKTNKARNAFLCSKNCSGEYFKGSRNGNFSNKYPHKKTCSICNKIFIIHTTINRKKNTCSKKCGHIFAGRKLQNRIIISCARCSKKIRLSKMKGEKRIYCSKKCMAEAYQKKLLLKNNPNWRGGKSFEPYPLGWRNTFKEQIRKRDDYKCQICGVPEAECLRKLCIHHIDYCKDNIRENNLISLCIYCHSKTNGKRKYWENILNERRNEIKIKNSEISEIFS